MPSLPKRALLLGGALLLGLLALLPLALRRPLAPPPPPPAPAPETRAAPLTAHAQKDGLALALTLRPTGPAKGGEALATLTLTDAKSGEPVRGVRPRVWMSRRQGEAAPTEGECRERIKTYLGGLLSAQADVDLNAWLLLTMNHDNTLSVINPQLAFSRTQLRSLVTLPAPAADWALAADKSVLFVTLPQVDKVAVVDLQRFLATQHLPVGREPQRLALSPDGRTLWVGNDGDGTVSVVDVQTRTVRATLEAGEGHHTFAFADEGRTVWVASSDEEEVAVYDAVTLQKVAGLAAGRGVVGMATSPLARAVLVANGQSGEVVVASVHGAKELRRVRLSPGLSSLFVEPSGRWAFALHRERGEVVVLDASAPEAAPRTLTGFSAPDTMAFTQAYAYVRNAGRAQLTLVRLDSLERGGSPTLVDVAAGQRPATEARRTAWASPLAPTPEGNSVMVASPGDQALAWYVEGMMAPMGTLKAYGREPRAALILDRSLTEVQPGVFTAPVQLGQAGTWDVSFLLDTPRTSHCFALTVGEEQAGPSPVPGHQVEVVPEFDVDARLPAGTPHALRLRVRDGASQAPLKPEEVSVLLFRPPGSWRWRGVPRQVGEGLFEVPFVPPAAGAYSLLVSVPSRGAPAGTFRPFTLRVDAPRASSPSTLSEVRP